ncbi:MAG: hypothetical protein DRQ55_06625 [Planctomycetota bacterium]|nr:MAG: hypothetical protein DRQ55_06625 [Planctomycetota bacterium]
MRVCSGLILLALALGALPGCFYVGGRAHVGPRLDAASVDSIVPGQSTRSQVLALLGPPAEFLEPELAAALLDDSLRLDGVLDVAHRAEQIWTWQGDTASLNGSALLLWNGFWLGTTTDLVVVGFDEDGVVTRVARSHARDGGPDA